MDLLALLRREFGERFEAICGAFCVCDEVTQQCTVAAHFYAEITIAPLGLDLGLEENFDAAVVADHVLELGFDTAYVTILDAEDAVDAEIAVEQLGFGDRPVIAAFFAELRNGDDVSLLPVRCVPVGAEGWRSSQVLDEVMHSDSRSVRGHGPPVTSAMDQADAF